MSTASRNLRMGIVFRGQVIAERVFDRRADISIGHRAGATVQVLPRDQPDFPEFVELMTVQDGQYYLVLPPDPTARISLRGAAAGEPVIVKGKRVILVDNLAGGSVSIGEMTAMFQFVRGDQVPLLTRERTVLRIGLVYDERLIDDQIFPDIKEIAVGNGARCTIALPDEDYQGPPLRFVNHKDGSATLRAPSAMKIRLAVDGAPTELKDLQAKGRARQEGDEVLCHMALGTRGRAVLGNYTVLFQVIKQTVTVPAMPTRGPLQRLTASFLADPPWWLSFAVSLLVIGGIAVQAHYFQRNTARFLKTEAEEQANKAVYEVEVVEKEEVKEPEPEKEEPEETNKAVAAIVAPQPGKKAEDKSNKNEAKADKQEAKPEAAGKQVDPEEAKRQARADLEKKSVLGAVNSAQAGAATKMFADSGDGEAGTVVAKAFGGDGGAGEGEGKGPGSAGIKLSSGGAGGGGTIEKVAGIKKGGFGERSADTTKDTGAKKQEEEVKVVLKSGGMEGGSGDSKSEVAKVVSRKNSAVQRCYEQALRDNPDEAGKVKVTFTVGTAGTVTDVSVSGASGSFAECIKAKFSSIRGLPTLESPQTFSQSYVFSKGG